jgi:hypothetical protein
MELKKALLLHEVIGDLDGMIIAGIILGNLIAPSHSMHDH